MRQNKPYNHISGLIAREFAGTITDRQKAELDKWIGEDPAHRDICSQIRDSYIAGGKKSYYRQEEIRKQWESLALDIRPAGGRNRRFGKVLRYASVIAVLALALGISYHYMGGEAPVAGITVIPMNDDNATVAAMVTHPDGTIMVVDDSGDTWADTENLLPREATRNYDRIGYAEEEQYRTVTVPRGTMLRAVIAEGIKVVINSDSELSYQVDPTGENRKVYVRGEVFFDIDGKLAHPLHVYTSGDVYIKVHGTAFNISAYRDEPFVATTLLRGSIEVVGPSRSTYIQPSQQLVYSKGGGNFFVHDVDVRPVVGWTEGKFYFENETMEQIMTRLSRWYDAKVTYSDESLKGIRYTGDLEWYDELETSLRMLEKVTSISIDIGNGIAVGRKK